MISYDSARALCDYLFRRVPGRLCDIAAGYFDRGMCDIAAGYFDRGMCDIDGRATIFSEPYAWLVFWN